MWISICRFKVFFLLNVLLHIQHWNFLLSVWISTCWFKLPFCRNERPHISQGYPCIVSGRIENVIRINETFKPHISHHFNDITYTKQSLKDGMVGFKAGIKGEGHINTIACNLYINVQTCIKLWRGFPHCRNSKFVRVCSLIGRYFYNMYVINKV